ncbi:hypothetical protein MNV49_003372 [Pseudohyphozyma bogoriensis]|nr:hypothetical protein MNV49_003372 [Pseudohyphozyma bogoriensis]
MGSLIADENRQRALDANVPTGALRVLGERIDAQCESGEGWTVDGLKVIRAGTGALMNMSLSFEPIQKALLESSALATIVQILDAKDVKTAIYVPGSWTDDEEEQENIEMGSMIVGWAMNILEDVLEDDKSSFPAASLPAFISPLLTRPSAPSTTPSPLTSSDVDLLTSLASLFEALSLASPSIKHAIAFSLYRPFEQLSVSDDTVLGQLFSFIEFASTPTAWKTSEEVEGEKVFGLIKSCVVRGVVDAPNDDEVMKKIMGDEDGIAIGKSWVVEQLVEWVRKYGGEEGREDLLVAATHMLAALGRSDEHCVTLVRHYQLVEPLAELLVAKVAAQLSGTGKPGEVTQTLFGVVSLLRHLAIPQMNKGELGANGIVQAVVPLLDTKFDVVAPLQNAVVGLLKHLTAGNVPNSLHFLTAIPSGSPSALDAILAITSRTDDVRLRSEATRSLVNVVRSFFSEPSPDVDSNGGEEESLKRRGRPLVIKPKVGEALSEMVRLSGKYPLLVNEGIVGLTLLAGSGGAGALMVLDALFHSHAPKSPPPSEASTDEASPPTADVHLSTSSDMLVSWLDLAASNKLATSPTQTTGVRPEMVGNACALIMTTSKGATSAGAETGKLEELRKKVETPLREVVQREAEESVLGGSARRALEAVSGP